MPPWSWKKVTRNDWVLMDEFMEIWAQAGWPIDAALFGTRNLRARVTYFYFTPAAALIAADLLEQYGAVPSDPPDFAQSALLVHPFLLVGDVRILAKNGW